LADAGRILIMPKGDYSPSVSYEMLDLVSHNNITWLAKKDVIGIEPSTANSEHWFKFTDEMTDAETLNGKSESELSVKNADTVDSYHANDFFKNHNTLLTETTTLKSLYSLLSEYSPMVFHYKTSANGTLPSDFPSDLVTDGTPSSLFNVIVKRIGNNYFYTIEGVFSNGNPYKLEGYYASAFFWRRVFTTAGGTLSGNLTIERANHSGVILKKSTFKRDGTKPSEVLYTNIHAYDAENNPIGTFQNYVTTGGNIYTAMNAYRNNSEKSYCQLGVRSGHDGTMYPYYNENGGTEKQILHTGNIAEHALPIGGGTLTGALQVSLDGNGKAQFFGNGATAFMTAVNKDGTVNRQARVKASGDVANCMDIYDSINKVSHTVLHTGNSNAVAIQSSAPTDTSALWVW